MTATQPQLMSLQDACASFGISYTKLYEAVQAEDVPAIKPFSRWLVAPDDVRAWLVEVDQKRRDGAA